MNPIRTEVATDRKSLRPPMAASAAVSSERTASLGGLCRSCEHVEGCSYASPIQDTWFCEEFSYSQPEPLAPTASPVFAIVDTTENKGLCVNCDHRDTCGLNKAEGGVWFCNEYR